METIIRSVFLRRSGTFWAGLALVLVTLFSWSMPTEAASRSGRQAQLQRNEISNSVGKSRSKRYKTKRAKVRSAGGKGRWIEVNLASQRLTAWENGRAVYSSRISSGKRSTPTRRGTYAIQRKYRAKTMRGPGYVAPNVPYTMFYSGGYAIHGAYWHNRFGTPVSHGCVNLPVGVSRNIYNWASVGTRVVVR
ncbi:MULTISPECIES: L,D-transpeptidase [Aerosakkonema]|uniref:L,D-transpeptidase n=1 Tax=Aerosakkonema TaxID=1246629 RepID=UPI0035B89652